jgi:hypothetical protein
VTRTERLWKLFWDLYEVDPLVSPRWRLRIKVLAVIERPAVVRQILEHVGLPSVVPASERDPTSRTVWRLTSPARDRASPSLTNLPVAHPVIASPEG